MFDSMKIINTCKSFLKKHNIPFNDEFQIYKKFGIIHCKIDGWRGPIELDGFPTISQNDAIFLILKACISEYFFEEERDIRDKLIKQYPKAYGEYDGRKYAFERIIQTFKNFSDSYYDKSIKYYTKYINMNKKTIYNWKYNKSIDSFVQIMAVIINKNTCDLIVYGIKILQSDLSKKTFNHLEKKQEKEYIRYIFSSDNYRYFLDVYNSKAVDDNDDYVMFGLADKVVWNWVVAEENMITRCSREYIYIKNNVKTKDDNYWQGFLNKKYDSKLFFDNINYMVSFGDEPEIEIYDRYGNSYFLIAYADFCDFYDKGDNYHKLNCIEEIENYIVFEDIVDIHDYGMQPSLDYSKDIKEQSVIIDGRIMY